jgi:phosphoglycolate phosphatase-like HAD superfamily hydrolase
VTRAVAIDLDGVLGDTRPIWNDWLASVAPLLGVEPSALPSDRGEAAAQLDDVGAGNWRVLLERFAEERVPVYLRPNAETSAALRRLESGEIRIGVFTDAPAELARVALTHVGAARRVEALEAGVAALERLCERLGADAVVVRTRAQLVATQLANALPRIRDTQNP